MINWDKIRQQFPVLDKYIYLNPAGGSPLSLSAAAAGKQYFDEMLAEGDAPYDSWLHRTEEIRKKLAMMINALPSELAFTPNTSTGMNLISMMLLNCGEVLTMKDEFPSSTIPWINMGYKLRFIEPVNHAYPINLIEQNISESTKVIVTSYVQYRTGFRQDIRAIGRICKNNNIIFVLNATQAFGVMPIDVREDGIDFMAFSGLKWATAGYGAGGVFMSNEMLKKYKIPFAGWQSTHNPDNMDNMIFRIRPEASSLEGGCPAFPSIFSMGGALDLILSIGINSIFLRVLSLNKYLQQEVEKLGLPVIAPVNEEDRSGILIIKTMNANAITSELAKKKILVASRGEGIRVSVNFFNNEQDIDTFIDEISKIKYLF